MTKPPERILAWTVNEWGSAWAVAPEDAAPDAVEYIRADLATIRDFRTVDPDANLGRWLRMDQPDHADDAPLVVIAILLGSVALVLIGGLILWWLS